MFLNFLIHYNDKATFRLPFPVFCPRALGLALAFFILNLPEPVYIFYQAGSSQLP